MLSYVTVQRFFERYCRDYIRQRTVKTAGKKERCLALIYLSFPMKKAYFLGLQQMLE
jgi:hypothetical protein